MLVDGHSIMNRAFYGVPDLTNAKGFHTNAIYGFLNIILKMVEDEKVGYLAVAFDVSAKTFRHDKFEAYKGTRKAMPEELREQIPVMKEVLKAMQIPVLEKAGFEADDLLGTLAKRGQAQGFEVCIVSGDRDLLQMASDKIKIKIPKTKGGKTEVEDYFWDDVIAKYQVNPIQFIDLKALMGDASDNIPGVPKVGEKTATQLLLDYETLDGVYQNLDKITKKAIKETLSENHDLAILSKELATICTDAEIEFAIEDAMITNLYTKEAFDFFAELELKNLMNRFDKQTTQTQQIKLEEKFILYNDFGAVEDFLLGAISASEVAFEFIEGAKNALIGLALSYGNATKEVECHGFIPCEGFVTSEYIIQKMSDLVCLFIKQQRPMYTFDGKKAYRYLECVQPEYVLDTKLAAYLINPLRSEYKVEDVGLEYLGLHIKSMKQYFEKLSIEEIAQSNVELLKEYACYHTYISFWAMPILLEELKKTQMVDLYFDMELPLTKVLYDMEREGILVRADELKEYGDILAVKIEEVQGKILEQSGVEFNINSPKQLGEVLFEKLGLPGGKKTKSGYSTAADVLEKLATDYPIVSDILEYRMLTKLKSTYADGLVQYIQEDGRIHSSFNQMIAATGRISSTEPNLQNIPTRSELGRLIRKVFVPKPGFIFVDADYSQIELRILAHMAKDVQLIEAYQSGDDIHRITASKVFHIPFDEVTDLQRRNAKAVNFGIVYGISSFGLSQDLSITRKEAKEYIDHYFETYTEIKAFLDNVVEDAKANGYTTTLFGRRRPIPELSSSNFMQRSFGERAAMNAPIQGTAADIMKIAMIKVAKELEHRKLESKLILQVHDELLVETKVEETEIVKEILEQQMREAVQLAVSLEVDVHAGDNWYEAK